MKITIGTQMYFLQLDSFLMADQTKQIECRITPVEIKWIYKYKDEDTKYLFDIWDSKFNKPETELFISKKWAEAEAKKRIDNININFIEEDVL